MSDAGANHPQRRAGALGEMSERVRAFDWGRTSLGPRDRWPQSLKAVVDLILASPMAMIVRWGPDFVQIYNDGYSALVGNEHAADLGRPTRECWPRVWEALEPTFAAALRGESLSLRDQELARGDGRGTVRLDYNLSPLTDDAGKPAGILATVVDATDRFETGVRLSESEQRFRLIVEQARDYAIFTTDTEGTVTDWLPGAEAVFGYDAGSIVGRHSEILYTPQDRAGGEVAKELAMAAETGHAPNIRWHQRRDGTLVFIEGSVTALRTPGGELRGFLKIGRDVTARRAAELELRQSRQQLRSLIAGIPQLVWRADRNGHCIWASQRWEAFTGLSLEASRGTGWLDAVHPDDRPGIEAAWTTAEDRGEFSADCRFREAASGRYRWFEIRALPSPDEAGDALEWFGTSTDIDDRRRLEEHQRVLLAELQHRVRNSLAVVRSIVRRTAETADTVEDYAMHLEGRIDAFARVQSAVTRDPGGRVSLLDLVADEMIAATAREGETVFIAGPDLRLPSRIAETFGLAVHELATNAIKFGALASDAGRIDIAWHVEETEEPGRLVFDWKETGVTLGEEPQRLGFGRELLERTLRYQIQAEASLAYEPDGLRCRIVLPLPG
ncbi:PAS domain S-box protein [Jiella sp. M17.18]|uniref:PAS domain-containing sensor histidine kinase n=1 Tax=Jiella sp. M17.18 TaxID=3234247 RepID=UPI0034DE6A66